MPVGTILTPRFPADEGWKQRGRQWYHRARPIDDFKASKINEATSASERIRHDTLDVLLGAAQALWKHRQVSTACRIRLRKDDVTGAFKTLPLRREDLPCAVAVLSESAKEGKAFLKRQKKGAGKKKKEEKVEEEEEEDEDDDDQANGDADDASD